MKMLGRKGVSNHVNPRDGHGQLETARACASGIQKQHPVPHLAPWLVRVPIDDGGKSRRLRVEVEGVHIMEHIQEDVASLHDVAQRQYAGPRSVVDVPTDSDRWRDGSEALEHVE